jgi:hypothetical protein
LYDGEIPYEKMREIISTNQTLACLGQRDEKRSLLPDGRFSGQITQNRPDKKIFLAGKNWWPYGHQFF